LYKNHEQIFQVNNIIGVVPKLETKQENIEPAVLNTQAYEAFLSKKEEKPKLGQGKKNVSL